MEKQERQTGIASTERDIALTNSLQIYLAGIHQEDPKWIINHGGELRKLFEAEPELFNKISAAMDEVDKRITH